MTQVKEEARGPRHRLGLVFGATVFLSAGSAYLFRPEHAGSLTFFLGILAGYALTGALAFHFLRRSGSHRALLIPRQGDITIGVVVGVAALALSFLGRDFAVRASPLHATWLLLVYTQMGPPEVVQTSVIHTASLALTVFLEELVFRAWAFNELKAHLGSFRALWVTSLLYAATLLPTTWTLSAPGLGPNPILFGSALALGLCLQTLALVTGRLSPAVVAHLVFTYFTFTQFRVPGLG